MSILNTASDGYFNVLIVLYKAACRFGPLPKDELIQICSAGPDSDTKRLGETLNRWTQLGLFDSKEEKIVIADNLLLPARRGKSVCPDPGQLPGLLRDILFREQNNQRFWDREGSLSADLNRGLAFLLAQDIYLIFNANRETIEHLERQQVIDEEKRVLQNDVRWNGLRSWGRYLGFLWVGEGYWVDPTQALSEELPDIFAENSELTAADFVQRVGTVLPVLDSGNYRRQIEEVLDPAQWNRPAREHLLSTSLSRALWRLHASNTLALEKRSDTGDSRTLQGRNGREWLTFTHIRLVEQEP